MEKFLFLLLVFLTVAGVVLGLIWFLQPNAVKQRLSNLELGPGEGGHSVSQWLDSLVSMVRPLAKLSVPKEGWESSAIRRQFIQAGFRDESAPVIFFALKTALALFLPLGLLMLMVLVFKQTNLSEVLPLLLVALFVGYLLPNAVLSKITEQRQRHITESFPDAMDLLTVCVEAGLSFDSALVRVAEEIRATSDVLADELQLLVLELRAGSGRETGLRNLALRCATPDMDAFAAIMIQSDRFGTSIADSLRTQSRALRTKRMQRAEEQAAKVGVKLVIPLVLCIFPMTLIVVVGPAIISIMQNLGTIFGAE